MLRKKIEKLKEVNNQLSEVLMKLEAEIFVNNVEIEHINIKRIEEQSLKFNQINK